MDSAELIQSISVQNVDVAHFARLAIADEAARAEIVRQMVTHSYIMVYFNCYLVVSQASRERPDLFYPYWRQIAPLLHHKNSYHRDAAITILANLTRADHEDLFAPLFEAYFVHLNDAKFMTGRYCVQSSGEIIRNRPEWRDRILAMLLHLDHLCAYTPKQIALLHSDVLDILEENFAALQDQEPVKAFMIDCLASLSPKTRVRAKELVRKYGIHFSKKEGV